MGAMQKIILIPCIVASAWWGRAALKPMRESRVPKSQSTKAWTSFLIKVNIPATAPDRRLYTKYGLVDKEIAFIEEKVKPME
jgi:hypothetical protein